MKLGERAGEFFGTLQGEICSALERIDGGAVFGLDRWEYEPGDGHGEGGGISRVLTGGSVFEKAGVNLSAVRGELSDRIARRLQVDMRRFFATGISLVVHPESPRIPTTHMNLRYLELYGTAGAVARSWFGGGADLTPYYLQEQDAIHFHRCLRDVCDRHDPDSYPRYKKWCDDYFFLPHRNEARGIGGIFFDYLEEDPEAVFDFVRDVGGSFMNAYGPIVERRRDEPWGDRERNWQLHRRGRYVEFNLIHDRGTLFGLETGGRTESILMSLPPLVRWTYAHTPAPGTPEATLLTALTTPQDWL